MAKPRIIVLMHYMELGGAEMALLGLLSALDPGRVVVDLFIYSHQGELMQHIPEHVNLLPETPAYSVIERPIVEAVRRGQFGVAVARLLAKWKHARYHKSLSGKHREHDASAFQYAANSLVKVLPKINPTVEYDLCISFLTPHNNGIDKVRARKRLAWIHTDYSTIHVNADQELPVWNGYDCIASISPDVTCSFIKVFPSLAPKITEIENIMPVEYIRNRADEFDASSEMPGDVKLLSIGRFCDAKNYDNVPDIARRMVEGGLAGLRWYIIGYGIDEPLIRRRIAEAGMGEHVIILGKRDNPYPYIKACDIYVQPSRYEGKSITVREAQMLGKPVAVTAYPTAPSQINHGVDGVIVPLDNAGCARGLTDFITDTALQQQITENLRTADIARTSEVEKIYQLLK